MRSLWLKLLISTALLAWLLARTPLHALAIPPYLVTKRTEPELPA